MAYLYSDSFLCMCVGCWVEIGSVADLGRMGIAFTFDVIKENNNKHLNEMKRIGFKDIQIIFRERMEAILVARKNY